MLMQAVSTRALLHNPVMLISRDKYSAKSLLFRCELGVLVNGLILRLSGKMQPEAANCHPRLKSSAERAKESSPPLKPSERSE
jgi:hypothetical protein